LGGFGEESEEVVEAFEGGEDEGESRSERDDERKARLVASRGVALLPCGRSRQLLKTSIGGREEVG